MSEIFNTTKAKKLNIELVIKALGDLSPYTLKKIADMTGLSVATCRNIIKELMLRNEVLELDSEEFSGGRPAKCYVYNPDNSRMAGLFIRLEKDRYQVTQAVANGIGEVFETGTCEYPSFSLDLIEETIDRLLQKHPAIKAVGIGVPGVVINGKVGDFCDIQELANSPLQEILTNKFQVKFLVENDMNLIALGFYRLQGYGIRKNIVVINFPADSCGGSGLIIDGHIMKGSTNFAGEISYLPLVVDRNKSAELTNPPDSNLQIIVKTLISMIAILNPDAIALTGELVQSDKMKAIIEGCQGIIPKYHMPEIIFRENVQDEYIKGLIAMAQNSLRYEVHLVKKRI